MQQAVQLCDPCMNINLTSPPPSINIGQLQYYLYIVAWNYISVKRNTFIKKYIFLMCWLWLFFEHSIWTHTILTNIRHLSVPCFIQIKYSLPGLATINGQNWSYVLYHFPNSFSRRHDLADDDLHSEMPYTNNEIPTSIITI